MPILPWCRYADDLISQLDLQSSINHLNQTFTRFGLSINALKTESMILICTGQESIIKLRNIDIKNIKTFKYLEAFINFEQPNTNQKIAKMTDLLQNFNISMKTRIHLLRYT
eukprot:TCONS_00027532-protein